MESWDFTTMALVSATLVAFICSYLGIFMVLRKITFVGIALAQLATAGIALSGLLSLPCTVGALITMLLGVSVFARDTGERKIPKEAIVGALYAMAGAAAILFTTFSPHSDADMLSLLFGNILGVTPTDIILIISTIIVVGGLHIAFSKEFLLVSFDPDMAQTLGYRTGFWNALFYLTLGVTIAVAIHAAGVLLVFGLLVFPPLTGLALSRRWGWACLISLVSALASVGSGVAASTHWDLPTGPTIIGIACLVWLLATLVGALPRRKVTA